MYLDAFSLPMANMIDELARYCGCQFVIATHSPFLLAIGGARVYDLDHDPAEIKNWWELENTKTYYSFFKNHRALFEESMTTFGKENTLPGMPRASARPIMSTPQPVRNAKRSWQR